MKLVDISRTKDKEYWKAKIDELETCSNIKNISDLYMGITKFKKGNQPGTNTVKDEKSDLVADLHSILLVEEPFLSAVHSFHSFIYFHSVDPYRVKLTLRIWNMS